MPASTDPLKKIREPFPAEAIGKLPKPLKGQDQDKGKCERGSRYSADGVFCGGWHARSIHLDFVGHAALTQRFLDVDPHWTWAPLAVDQQGMPVLDRNGGLWINLTVAGVTRPGYGDGGGKSGGNAVKEAIGDALRNAGMRFGAALDLWHKGDLPTTSEDDTAVAPAAPPAAPETRGRTNYSVAIMSANEAVLRSIQDTIKADDTYSDDEKRVFWRQMRARREQLEAQA